MKDSKVVPVSENTMNKILKDKIYLFPKINNIHHQNIRYIFFYVIKPVQKIIYYAEIDKYIDDAEHMINIIEKMKMFREPLKHASAYSFLKIKKLKNDIVFNKNGSNIQRATYGECSKILMMKDTGELCAVKDGV